MSISPEIMRKFVFSAADRLIGPWVIIGGSVLHLLNIAARQTEDIDLAGPVTSTQAESLILMELAESFGFPVESINQAGAYFLFKIQGWEQKLISVHKGSTGTIYRPNLELFFELKLARLTPSDVTDCINYLHYTVKNNETFDRDVLVDLCRTRVKLPGKKMYSDELIKAIQSI
jgi:hypothetical protein